jgi:outer membrane lipoprotein-sorting protein
MGRTVLSPRNRLLLLVALVLAASGAFFAAVGRSETVTLTSYYFEARLTVVQADVEPDGFEHEKPLDTIRGWYEAPDKWVWDFSDSKRATTGSTQIGDGEDVWYYDRLTNTYSRVSYADYFRGRSPDLSDGPQPIIASVFVGPLPYQDPERFFRAFAVDAQRSEKDGGLVAGRPTRAMTYTRGEEHTTFWLDREFAFVLKYVSHDPGFSVSAEVLSVSFNQALPGQPFVFQPPPSAREVAPPPPGPVHEGGSIVPGVVPQGFLSIGYTPAGFEATGQSEASGVGGATTFVAVRYQPHGQTGTGGDYLLIEQQYRAGGLAPSQLSGTPLTIGAVTGYESSTNGALRLVWAKGDVVVTLSSNVLPLEELIKVALSLS